MNSSHTFIIAEIIKACHYQKYLELGIQSGVTYNYIKPYVELAVAVDMNDTSAISPDNFYHMKTDDFFKQNTLTFDAIFIDACHEYEQVKKDFNNAVKCLNKAGTIFLHDTDPDCQEYMLPIWCGDSCKMNQYLQSLELYQFVTIPIDKCGLSIVRIKNDNRSIQFTETN